jgi:hypothetical protein
MRLRTAGALTPLTYGSQHGGVGAHLVRFLARCWSRINTGGHLEARRQGAAPLWCQEGTAATLTPVPVHQHRRTTHLEIVREEP